MGPLMTAWAEMFKNIKRNSSFPGGSMNKDRLITVLAAVVFLVGVLLLGRLVWKNMDGKDAAPVAGSAPGVVSDDPLKILREGTASEDQIMIALVRVGSTKAPEAKELILKYVDDARGRVRQAAVFALGAFGDQDTLAVLQNLATDADPAKRKNAYFSLARAEKGPAVTALVDQLVEKQKSKLNKNEFLYLRVLQLRHTTDSNSRLKMRNQILADLKGKVEREVLGFSYSRIFTDFPNDPKLLSLAKQMLDSQELVTWTSSFNYLRMNDKEGLLKALDRVKIPEGRGPHSMVGSFLMQDCPSSWKTILSKLNELPQPMIDSVNRKCGAQ
jgi:hypothetical protein